MKIRKRTYPTGKIVWVVDFGIVEGKRKQIKCDSQEAARGELAKGKALRSAHGGTALAITEADRVRYEAAHAQLAAVNATIEQAVAHFLRTARKLKEPISLAEALEKCIVEKEQRGMRKRSLQQFRCSCISFVRRYPQKRSNEITREDVQEWVDANGWAPKTQRVYFGDLRALCAWLVKKGLSAENPCVAERDAERVELSKMTEAEITAFDPDTCERLLAGALVLTEARASGEAFVFRPLLGYLALATFAGIRPEEIKRSGVEAIHLEESTVLITAEVSKTSRRRAVDLSECATDWLALWRGLCPAQRKIIPPNFRRLWERLRERVGLDVWPHDILRHTFASMHYALHKDRARLQAELGHSADEDTLDRHYRSVRTLAGSPISRPMAERFWGMFPPPRYREVANVCNRDRD